MGDGIRKDGQTRRRTFPAFQPEWFYHRERDVHCVHKARLEQRVERPNDDDEVSLTFPLQSLDHLARLTMKRRTGPL